MSTYHRPVMLQEALEGLNIDPNGIYVDATYGGGGHAGAILEKLENGRLIAFDIDPDAQANAIDDKRFELVNHNFEHLKRFLKLQKAIPVNGILADLGVSSHQFDTPERGFSTRFEGELDMRMDRQQGVDAKSILNSYSEERLQEILSRYGEVRNARTAAKAIANARQANPIKTTQQLIGIVEPIIKGKRNQYLAQVFQAIRIEVNNEVGVLKSFLEQTGGVLAKGGRLVVISYHSLEDRQVKNFMKRGSFEGELVKNFYGQPEKPFMEVNRKPIIAENEEIKNNPRARSAKLRVAEKI